ncbi:MAG TPA: hypothetical protein VHX40_01875, partial [Acidimicrobiales bacterium]|nr:hypothetical protein [Acidimicrobiales bacterium]
PWWERLLDGSGLLESPVHTIEEAPFMAADASADPPSTSSAIGSHGRADRQAARTAAKDATTVLASCWARSVRRIHTLYTHSAAIARGRPTSYG